MIETRLDTRDLAGAVDGALAGVDSAITAGVEHGVTAVASRARDTSAFRDKSGDTRKSIRASETKATAEGADGEIMADGAAKFLEGGTVHVDAHPFLDPALDDGFDEVVHEFVEGLEDALQKAGW